MTISLPLVLEASRRRRSPEFGILSRGAARSLSSQLVAPIAEEVARHRVSADGLLFAARVHGISGLLSRLADQDPSALPAEHVAALAAERGNVGERGRSLLEDLRNLGRVSARLGLPLIPLKGAFLSSERYRDLSLRPAADIDLLAPGDTFEPWCRLLEAEGYVLENESWKNRAYVRAGHREPTGFGEHPENPRPVEVHQRVRERFLGRTLDITDVLLARLTDGFVDGDIAARLPGDTALFLHLFAHAAPAAVGRGLRLIQLVDVSQVVPRGDTADVLIERLGEAAWGLAALIEKGLPGALPEPLRSSLAARAPAIRRQRLWLSRPGLMTGDEEKTILVWAELGLCQNFGSVAGRLADALPERAVLRNLYGDRSHGDGSQGDGSQGNTRTLHAFGRYIRDRFR